MSCDFNNPDSIDLGSLAIGASGNPSINQWSQNPELVSRNNNPVYQNEGYFPPATLSNDHPVSHVPDLKPNFANPKPQAPAGGFPGMGGGGGFPGMGGGSFSTMKMLGFLSDKTIERFFAPLKQPQTSAPEMNFSSFNYSGQQPPIPLNSGGMGGNSNPCRFSNASGMPNVSPQQNVNPNYANHSYTSGNNINNGKYYSPQFSGESQVSPGMQPWSEAQAYSGQDQLRNRMPAVKMEWNEFNSGSMNNRIHGQPMYPG